MCETKTKRNEISESEITLEDEDEKKVNVSALQLIAQGSAV